MENENKRSTDTELYEQSVFNDTELDVEENGIADDFGQAEPPVQYEPKNKYEKLLYSVYRDETLAEILRISSYAIVALTIYAFFVRLVSLAQAPVEILKILIVTGVPFVIVSIMRKLIAAPRPYELFEFYEKKPKGKAGQSFPSRHVFSVFVIATVLFAWEPVIAAGLVVLGVVLAFLRVALGIHFVRDAVAGGLIGIVSGIIGLCAIYFI